MEIKDCSIFTTSQSKSFRDFKVDKWTGVCGIQKTVIAVIAVKNVWCGQVDRWTTFWGRREYSLFLLPLLVSAFVCPYLCLLDSVCARSCLLYQYALIIFDIFSIGMFKSKFKDSPKARFTRHRIFGSQFAPSIRLLCFYGGGLDGVKTSKPLKPFSLSSYHGYVLCLWRPRALQWQAYNFIKNGRLREWSFWSFLKPLRDFCVCRLL